MAIKTLKVGAVNKKGGVGKSTVITELAFMSAYMGRKTTIIDTDNGQHSIDALYIVREELLGDTGNVDFNGCLSLMVEEPEMLDDAIMAAEADGAEVIFIDLAGENNTAVSSAMNKCNIVLCPTSHSPRDLSVLANAANLMQAAQKYRKEHRLHVLQNMVTGNAFTRRHHLNKTKAMVEAFSDQMSLLDVQISRSEHINKAAEEGKALFEILNTEIKAKGSTTFQDFKALYKLIFNEDFVLATEKREAI